MRAPQLLAAVIIAIASGAAVASEPGQPLDCSDWVFAEPGFSCSDYNPWPATGGFLRGGTVPVADNEGLLYRLRFHSEVVGSCGSNLLYRHTIHRIEGPNAAPFAWIDDKCIDVGTGDRYFLTYPGADYLDPGRLVFVHNDGRLLAAIRMVCARPSGECPGNPAGDEQIWVAAISGFTTQFQIFHSFAPSESLSFRVPSMPEGMAAADHFDTYWGDLATVGDWSQAHGLQCSYPAAPPPVGDYLTVADTLPTPSPDHGYYYVTAATYQGQTRYGRKTSGGRLSGRDPAVLPACSTADQVGIEFGTQHQEGPMSGSLIPPTVRAAARNRPSSYHGNRE